MMQGEWDFKERGGNDLQKTLKYQRLIRPHLLAKRLMKKGVSKHESELIEDLLLKMLQIDPGMMNE